VRLVRDRLLEVMSYLLKLATSQLDWEVIQIKLFCFYEDYFSLEGF